MIVLVGEDLLGPLAVIQLSFPVTTDVPIDPYRLECDGRATQKCFIRRPHTEIAKH